MVFLWFSYGFPMVYQGLNHQRPPGFEAPSREDPTIDLGVMEKLDVHRKTP